MSSLGAPNEHPGHSSQWCVNRPWSDESIDCEGRQARSGCDWSRRFIAALQWTEAPAAINPPLGRAMPPNGRTSALGEGPARDWQINVSRGSQGTAAAQVGRSPSWSAAQTFLADGIPSLREQECCDDPVSHCPVGGVTAMQPASDQWDPNSDGTVAAACPAPPCLHALTILIAKLAVQSLTRAGSQPACSSAASTYPLHSRCRKQTSNHHRVV